MTIDEADDTSIIPPRPYLRDEVFQRIKEHVAGLAASGTAPVILREADLARQFGVSRTPVREALNRLVQDGLVVLEPRRGAKVRPTSLEDYLAWLEIREALEGFAARLSALRASPATVAEMRALFTQFEGVDIDAGPGAVAFAKANAHFHRMLVQSSGNALLIRVAQTYDHMGTVQLKIIERLHRAPNSLTEHQSIIDAIAAQDGDAADLAARQHVRELRDEVRQKLLALEPIAK